MFFDFPFAFPFLCTPWFGKGAMSIPQRGNQLSKGATACLASEKRGSRSPHPPEADSPLVLRALLFTSPLKEAGQARPARGSHIPTAKGVRLWRTLRTWCLPRLKGGPRLSRLPLRGSLIFRTSQNINPIPFLDPGASKAVVSSKNRVRRRRRASFTFAESPPCRPAKSARRARQADRFLSPNAENHASLRHVHYAPAVMVFASLKGGGWACLDSGKRRARL